MFTTPTVSLNNGIQMPSVGLGVYQVAPGTETEQSVTFALQSGYRLIDTARYYENEESVGRALRASGIPREQLFVTTKLWNADHGFDPSLRAFDDSLKKLGLDYLDLYLIHWPVAAPPWQNWKPLRAIMNQVRGRSSRPLRMESWRALEKIAAQGRCRAIGVSNYTIHHLEELLATCKIAPAVNQVEFTPFLYQQELLAFCRRHGIQLEAYSPLTRGQRLKHPVVAGLAGKYERSPAQILIRWALQHDVVAIPKATTRSHIQENISVFDFSISPTDMASLNGLNENLHLCWDPSSVT
jgi:diketogulonate reductase-like aldo/keto reductase